MPRHPDDMPPERQETVERREVVERYDRPAGPDPVPPREGMNLIWLLPLLVLVIALVWFVFTRGERATPAERINVEVPQMEAPRIERRIEIEVPQTQPQTPPQTQPQPPAETPPPGDP